MNENNYQTPTPPLSSLPPTQPIIPVDGSQARRKKKILIVISVVLAVILLLVASLIIIAKKDKTDNGNTNQSKPTFTDWLKPEQELKVGEHRYISVCQLLPEESVSGIFGLNDSRRVAEEYLDQTVPNARNNASHDVDTVCTYDSGQELEIELQQTSENTDNRSGSDWASELSRDEAAITDTMKLFEKAKDVSANKDAQEFYNHLKDSVTKYNEVMAARNDSTKPTPKGTLTSATVPGRNPGSTDFVFTGTHKGVVVKLSHKLASTSRADKKDYTPEELTKELAMMNQAFAVMRKNIDNQTLSQSPAPTIRGNTDMVGTTKVLEVCRVLNASAFEAITGIQQNYSVRRSGLPVDLSKIGVAKDGSPVLPSSSCDRQYSAGNLPGGYILTPTEQKYGKGGYISIKLRLENATSKEEADKIWTKMINTPGIDTLTPATTSADKAVFSTFNKIKSIYFMVGPYTGSVSIDEVQSTGGVTSKLNEITTDDTLFIQAVNQFTANIKALKQQK